jgi:hypothetical protein
MILIIYKKIIVEILFKIQILTVIISLNLVVSFGESFYGLDFFKIFNFSFYNQFFPILFG